MQKVLGGVVGLVGWKPSQLEKWVAPQKRAAHSFPAGGNTDDSLSAFVLAALVEANSKLRPRKTLPSTEH